MIVHSIPQNAQTPGEDFLRETVYAEGTAETQFVEGFTGVCTFCAEDFPEPPAVVWQLPGATLWLHPKCAVSLGTRLIGDEARIGYVSIGQIENWTRQIRRGK